LDEQPVETTPYSLQDSPPGMPDRRDGERHLSLLRVGSLTIDGRRELCLIRNVSAGGMLIRPYCTIPENARLTIELKQGDPISGHARWTKDGCVGVTFDERIDVVELLAACSEEGQRPRMPRVEVDCLAWVRDGATVHRGRAVNISQGGLRIEQCRAEIAVGTEVTVSILGLVPLPGTVRWNDGEACGITFARVLALPQLVAWLHDQRARMRAAS
jgi:hypothetical protein